MQTVEAEPALVPQDVSPRKNRGFCKLQTAVNRYLDDSGYWIDHVSDVLRQLRRLHKECDNREQELAERERLLRQRELAVDRLLLQLNGHAALPQSLDRVAAEPAAAEEDLAAPSRSRFDAERRRRQA